LIISKLFPLFLIFLGIGVDDMFVLLSGLASTSTNDDIETRIGETMKHSWISITITSVTDIVAFCVGSKSIFPSVNDFQFRWIQGLINPWNMIFPWVDQSLYSPHGVINCMLFYKRIRKQNFLLYMFFSSILIRQERNTIFVCFIWIYKCIVALMA
jgi:hypothetical protein